MIIEIIGIIFCAIILTVIKLWGEVGMESRKNSGKEKSVSMPQCAEPGCNTYVSPLIYNRVNCGKYENWEEYYCLKHKKKYDRKITHRNDSVWVESKTVPGVVEIKKNLSWTEYFKDGKRVDKNGKRITKNQLEQYLDSQGLVKYGSK